jgi:RNA recognition motif-containing protein
MVKAMRSYRDRGIGGYMKVFNLLIIIIVVVVMSSSCGVPPRDISSINKITIEKMIYYNDDEIISELGNPYLTDINGSKIEDSSSISQLCSLVYNLSIKRKNYENFKTEFAYLCFWDSEDEIKLIIALSLDESMVVVYSGIQSDGKIFLGEVLQMYEGDTFYKSLLKIVPLEDIPSISKEVLILKKRLARKSGTGL